MQPIKFELGGGATLALPANVVAQRLIESLQAQQLHPFAARPRIGEYLSGHGGIYVGDILGDDSVLYGLIAAKDEDVGKAKWGESGDLQLSAWDGMSNTNALRGRSPAAKLASEYECDGHCDFYLPARRELLIAAANVPGLFGNESWYWTSTACGESSAWAVDFEHGHVYLINRPHELRVRPFRSVIASVI